MTDRHLVSAHYDQAAATEYARLTQTPLHQAEWLLTLDLIHRHVAPGAKVIDIGAGPGRYAEYLIRQMGCQVGVTDLSPVSVDRFRQRLAPELQEQVLFAQAGCATDLGWVADASFDAALLLGPLYHLQDEGERLAALSEARRVLRPGGYLFAAYLSPYPLFARLLRREPDLLCDADAVTDLARGGAVDLPNLSRLVEQYRCWPAQAQALMAQAGFSVVGLRNLEGPSIFAEDLLRELSTEAQREGWFHLLRETCENPDLLGATIHFLGVGRKE
ncbi:MAG: Methyltransferase type 11 [Symbiobacteriaceae bacterium]|jgi:ubiquinone/menaquinone biosynthesis C-methylase UbiE|nr:Methyltransferase type 11 [Symbiobacteriaceae bacterium]